ncbi:MAG: hypothetical protein ACFCUI_05955, partial [Bernardetiaceae bacterium]
KNLDVIQKMIKTKEDVSSFPKKWDISVQESGFLNKKQIVIFFIRDIEKPADTSMGIFITEKNFKEEFAKLTLKGIKSVFCIEYEENFDKINNKWKIITLSYRDTQNSFLFVDPDFSTWKEADIKSNLIPLIEGIKKNNSKSSHLTILSEIKERKEEELSLDNFVDVLRSSLGIKYIQIFFFDRNEKRIGIKVKNYLHDRYLFTETLQFISCHSWKKVDENREKQPIIKQNSQIIVLPVLNPDVLDFTYFKLKSYWDLIKFAQTAPNHQVKKASTYDFKNPLFNLVS